MESGEWRLCHSSVQTLAFRGRQILSRREVGPLTLGLNGLFLPCRQLYPYGRTGRGEPQAQLLSPASLSRAHTPGTGVKASIARLPCLSLEPVPQEDSDQGLYFCCPDPSRTEVPEGRGSCRVIGHTFSLPTPHPPNDLKESFALLEGCGAGQNNFSRTNETSFLPGSTIQVIVFLKN